LDDEELASGLKYIIIDEVEPISRLPLYLPPRKPMSKVKKDLNPIKYEVFTLPLLEDVPIEGELLAWVLQLKMEDWDLNDRST